MSNLNHQPIGSEVVKHQEWLDFTRKYNQVANMAFRYLGKVTLVAGVAKVINPACKTTSTISVTPQASPVGRLYATASNGFFTVNSTSASDGILVNYELFP